MSWFFKTSTPSSNLPAPTSLQQQRSRQIESLKKKYPTTVELKRDMEYRCTFTVGHVSLSLFITLPPEFPQQKPTMRLTPCIRHPWVADNGEFFNCPALISFAMHSDLGLVVKEIIDEFSRSPPQYAGGSFQSFAASSSSAVPSSGGLPYAVHPAQPAFPSPGSGLGAPAPPPSPCAMTSYSQPTQHQPPYGPRYTQPSHGVAATSTPQQRLAGAGPYIMPDLPASFPDLREMTAPELQKLVDDEDLLLGHLQTSDQLNQLVSDGKEIALMNEDLANENLRRRPELEQFRESLLQKHEEAESLRQQLEELVSKQHEISQHFRPDCLQDRLRVAALESEETSDEMAEQFLAGDMAIEEFLKSFLPLRTTYHSRRVREEKMQQLLERGGPGPF